MTSPTETELKPTADLLNAASRYLKAQTDLRAAEDSIAAQLHDYVRDHFPIVDNPWHETRFKPIWLAGECVVIEVAQIYTDEHGRRTKKFRINLKWEF